jgi:hypothetical protein
MKVNLEPNYTVQVRQQTWEHEPDIASFYKGIITITLNQFVDIAFVPTLPSDIPQKLDLPENFDDITSPEEAAFTILFASDYVIVPIDKRKGDGDARRIHAALGDSDVKSDCGLFTVSSQQFNRFVQELETLAQQQQSVHDFVRYNDVAKLEVFRYLENFVFQTTIVHEKHLDILRKPYAQFIRRCVAQVDVYNRINSPLIYHGYFDRLQSPEIYENGFDTWEHVVVGMRKRFVPDKRRLLFNMTRTFWCIHRSAKIPEDDPNWQDHLIYGVEIWRDGENADLVHIETFKQWRWLDDWWPFPASPKLVETRDETDESERITFALSDVNNNEFAAKLIAYVGGQTDTIT